MFKSPAQRKFMFSVLADKKKGTTSGINPAPSGSSNPMMNKSSQQSISLKTPQAPMQQIKPMKVNSISPTSNPGLQLPKLGSQQKAATIPALPGMPKPAKFAKVKKFFK